MMQYSEPDITLIRARQHRFVQLLVNAQLPGALITTPENVQYLTGFRPVRHRPGALWIDADGATTLAHAEGDVSGATVASMRTYVSNRAGTLVDHPVGEAIAALGSCFPQTGVCGADAFSLVGQRESVNLMQPLLSLRRTKDALDIRLIKESIAGVQTIYERIRAALRPGMTEVEVCAECHAAAVKFAGRPIGWLGNDFQSGTGGGLPRERAIEAGELMPLDLGFGANGYIADMCRTFCVGGEPTPLQRRAHARVLEVFDLVLPQLRPGVSCAALHELAIARLHDFEGLKFEHHLGHGIGLNAHEQPRVNRNWNDTLAAGDLITLEPGLYGQTINGGVRLEDIFLITDSGSEQLSAYPLDFVLAGS